MYRALKEGPLGRKSYAFNLIRDVLRKGLESVHTFEKHAFERASPHQKTNFRYRVTTADDRRVAFNSKNNDLDEVEYARYVVSGQVDLELFTSPLEAFRNLAREYQFTPVVTYLPSAYSAYGDAVTFEDSAVGAVLRTASERERAFFRKKTQEFGIAFLDLTPSLADRSRDPSFGENLYFPSSMHLTAVGHQIVASALADFLRSHGLLR
jgi:hypothetical protein